uniref:Uncharacterized protein n=1 Tax=Percolomonas cosmopolitus TaxID=63605 RepID=A0A7S1PHT0_9EUKA
MYIELQQLKQQITGLETENLKLRTQVQKVEQGRERKERQVEELLKAHAIVETKGRKYESLFKEVSLMKRLKQRVRELESELQQRDEEFDRIRLDSRYTRVRELETEMKTYYAESRRLQTLVDQMQMEHEQMMNNMAATGAMTGAPPSYVNTVELQQLREKNAKFRDLVMKMKQMQDHLKEQNDILSDQLRQYQDGESPNPLDNTQELQHLKNENERLLHQREKLRSDHAQLLEQSKNSNNELSDLNRMLKRSQAQLKETEENFETYKAESEQERVQIENRAQELEARVQQLAEEVQQKPQPVEPVAAASSESPPTQNAATPQKRSSVVRSEHAPSPRRESKTSPASRRQSSQLVSPAGSRRQSATSQKRGSVISRNSESTPVRRSSHASQLSLHSSATPRSQKSAPDSSLKTDRLPEPTRSNSPLLGEDEEDEEFEEDDSVVDPEETENVTDEDDMDVHDDHVAEIPNSRKYAFDDDDESEDPFAAEEREKQPTASRSAVKRASTSSAAGRANQNTRKSTMESAMDAADTISDPFQTPREEALDDDEDSFDREMEAEFGGGDLGDDFLDDDLDEDTDDNDNFLG